MLSDRLFEQMGELVKRQAQVTGKGGKSRQTSTAEKTRQAVFQAIMGKKGAVQAIRKAAAQSQFPTDFEEMAKHLEAAVTTGFMLMYRPQVELPWSL